MYDYRVKRRKVSFKNLPSAFDGIKICHISDIHVGSLKNRLAVRGGLDMILNEKPDAIAADIPNITLLGSNSIAIGPNKDVVAELVKKFAVKPVIIVINDQLNDESSGRLDIIMLNLLINHSAAPVSLIWNPRDIVAANNKITPQLVFLFITSHDTIPQIIKINTPHNAIIPNPNCSLNKNQPATIIAIIIDENMCLMFVALFDFATDFLYPCSCILSNELGNTNCKTNKIKSLEKWVLF
mgnify:CR=1 FL=1